MTDGFTILGAVSSDMTGWSVSGAGDVNNDTFADVIIGAPYAGLQVTGAAYVIYGKESPFVLIDLGDLSSMDGYAIYGIATSDYLGLSVSGAGDVNGDGFDDIVIGALRTSKSLSGAAYVVYGQRDKLSSDLQLFLTSNARVSVLTGISYSWFGYSVSGAGDVNKDGFDDVIVGSVPRKTILGTPISYLIYGNKTVAVSDVTKMTASQGVVITGGGVVVSGVGDINGDGFDDAMVGGDYGFDSGGGYVVCLPSKIQSPTTLPTIRPTNTVDPTRLPTLSPSTIPTASPTAPSQIPTLSPSGPSQDPTESPTHPTEAPSATPSVEPTRSPSLEPSHGPTIAPSVVPYILPTRTPSAVPSFGLTTSPNTNSPSVKPTVSITLMPTRYPVVRPTLHPSALEEPTHPNITYIELNVVSGGVYERNTSHLHFIVNSTEDVVIVGAGGSSLFTVAPNANTSLTIRHFNHTFDVIDLKSFVNIHSLDELLFKASHDVSRVLASAALHSTTLQIGVGSGQYIYIDNTSVVDLSTRNFVFAEVSSHTSAIGDMKPSYGPLIVGLSVAAVFVLFLLYQCTLYIRQYYYDKSMIIDTKAWNDAERNNPTYYSFIGGDSWMSDKSLFSNISDLSSSSQHSSFESTSAASAHSDEAMIESFDIDSNSSVNSEGESKSIDSEFCMNETQSLPESKESDDKNQQIQHSERVFRNAYRQESESVYSDRKSEKNSEDEMSFDSYAFSLNSINNANDNDTNYRNSYHTTTAYEVDLRVINDRNINDDHYSNNCFEQQYVDYNTSEQYNHHNEYHYPQYDIQHNEILSQQACNYSQFDSLYHDRSNEKD